MSDDQSDRREALTAHGFEAAAQHLARSFTSAQNLPSLDRTMTWVCHAAKQSGCGVLEVDLRTGEAHPPELSGKPISEAIAHYVRWFPRFIAQEGLPLRSVTAARLSLVIDLQRVEARSRYAEELEFPFECTVVIEEAQAGKHVAAVAGVWRTAREPAVKPRRFWWQFWRHHAN